MYLFFLQQPLIILQLRWKQMLLNANTEEQITIQRMYQKTLTPCRKLHIQFSGAANPKTLIILYKFLRTISLIECKGNFQTKLY